MWAAGNYSSDCPDGWNTVADGQQPSKNVLTVGNSTQQNNINSSSSRGPVADGRVKPEISAVGTSVYSTYLTDDYQSLTGTSMATPTVSGTMAVLSQAYDSLVGGRPRSDLLKALVCNTAYDFDNAGLDYRAGYGALQGHQALEAIDSNWFDVAQSVDDADSVTINIPVWSTSNTVRAMVCWIDEPAVAFSTTTLIQNIDIILESPSGDRYSPWVLDPDNPADLCARGTDSLNNIEQVSLTPDETGVWKLIVLGTDLPMGTQDFAATWYYDKDRMVLLGPLGGENYETGVSFYTMYNNGTSTDSTHIEVSTNEGASWIDAGKTSYRSESLEFTFNNYDKYKFRFSNATSTATAPASTFRMAYIDAPSVTTQSVTSACLTWDVAVETATHYSIEMATNGYWSHVTTTASTNAVVSGLSSDTEYLFRVSYVGTNGDTYYTRVAFHTQATLYSQRVPLREGWNLVSSYVDPCSDSIQHVLSEVAHNIDAVHDGSGNTYIPSSTNTIGVWDFKRSYLVHASAVDTIELVGFAVAPTTNSVSLPAFHTNMGYFRTQPQGVDTAMQEILTKLHYVKDVAGRSYFPHYGINTLGSLNPGTGYRTMSNTTTLTYQANASIDSVLVVTPIATPTYFTFAQRTGTSATMILETTVNPTVGGNPLAVGDEIGVFTSTGTCVGAAIWQNNNLAITVWGDDQLTSAVDGAVDGDTLLFRVWRQSENKLYDSTVVAASFLRAEYLADLYAVLSQFEAYSTYTPFMYATGLPALTTSTVSTRAYVMTGSFPTMPSVALERRDLNNSTLRSVSCSVSGSLGTQASLTVVAPTLSLTTTGSFVFVISDGVTSHSVNMHVYTTISSVGIASSRLLRTNGTSAIVMTGVFNVGATAIVQRLSTTGSVLGTSSCAVSQSSSATRISSSLTAVPEAGALSQTGRYRMVVTDLSGSTSQTFKVRGVLSLASTELPARQATYSPDTLVINGVFNDSTYVVLRTLSTTGSVLNSHVCTTRIDTVDALTSATMTVFTGGSTMYPSGRKQLFLSDDFGSTSAIFRVYHEPSLTSIVPDSIPRTPLTKSFTLNGGFNYTPTIKLSQLNADGDSIGVVDCTVSQDIEDDYFTSSIRLSTPAMTLSTVGTYSVTVTDPNGVMYTTFAVAPIPQVSVTSISPSMTTASFTPSVFTLHGVFNEGSTVEHSVLNSNGTVAFSVLGQVLSQSSTTLTVYLQSGSCATSGNIEVTVTDLAGSSTISFEVVDRHFGALDYVQCTGSVEIDVFANDEHDSAALLGVEGVHFGSAVIDGNTIEYTPESGFYGSESFEYMFGFENGATTSGTVVVDVVAEQDLFTNAEQTDRVITNTRGVSKMKRPRETVFSPNGQHVYVAGYSSNAVNHFTLSTSGQLTFVDHVNGSGKGLARAVALAMSPDGKTLYSASRSEYAIGVFSIDATTGSLTFIERVRRNVNGVDGLKNVEDVVVSPDGRNVYTVSSADRKLTVFRRNTTTGTLTYVERFKDGQGGVNKMHTPRAIAISADGTSVYVAAYSDHAVSVFDRNVTTGRLTYVEFHKDGSNGIKYLSGASGVDVSSDLSHVFVTSYRDNAVNVFERSSSGTLVFVEAFVDGKGDVSGLGGAYEVDAAATGQELFVAGRARNAIVHLSRDNTTGDVEFTSMYKRNVGGVTGLYRPYNVASDPTGTFFIGSGNYDNSVSVFRMLEARMPERESDPITEIAKQTVTNESRILVYPSPARSEITLELPSGVGACDISIVDVAGRVVLMLPSTTVTPGNPMNCDIQQLPAGLYTVMAQNDNTCLYATFIVLD